MANFGDGSAVVGFDDDRVERDVEDEAAPHRAAEASERMLWSVRISQWRTSHGSGSWRVCIPLSASAHANLWPREVCVRENNRVQAAHRARSIRDWL